jgi:hypothetical protein
MTLHRLMEPLDRENLIYHPHPQQFLRPDTLPQHQNLIRPVRPHVVRPVVRRSVLGDQAQLGEGHVQPGALGRVEQVAAALKPGRAGADARPVHREHEDFPVVDQAAGELDAFGHARGEEGFLLAVVGEVGLAACDIYFYARRRVMSVWSGGGHWRKMARFSICA